LANLQAFIPLILLLVLMYFMIMRPQQQQAKKRQELLSSLQAGQDVVTIGGIHGTIVAIDDTTVRLKVAPNVEMTFNRSAVGTVKK